MALSNLVSCHHMLLVLCCGMYCTAQQGFCLSCEFLCSNHEMISSAIFGKALLENMPEKMQTCMDCHCHQCSLFGEKFKVYEGFKQRHFPLMSDLGPVVLHQQSQRSLYWKEKNRKYIIRPSPEERLLWTLAGKIPVHFKCLWLY